VNNKEFAKTMHKERFAPSSNSVSDLVRANLALMVYDPDPEATTNFKKCFLPACLFKILQIYRNGAMVKLYPDPFC
jgi:hypothetical protein